MRPPQLPEEMTTNGNQADYDILMSGCKSRYIHEFVDEANDGRDY